MNSYMRGPEASTGHKSHKRLHTPVRENNSSDSANRGQEQAFGEKLPSEGPAPGPSRTASSFWPAADRASSNPATFVQAINKTMLTAAIKIVSGLDARSR